MNITQSDLWDNLAAGVDVERLKVSVKHPDEFQSELKQYIDSLYHENSKVIEVGSFTGVTSLILDDRFDKTLLDLNGTLLSVSEQLFSHYGKRATFVQGDMFQMPFRNETFDIVFNAGVVEHFGIQERTKAIAEYGRILKPGGAMVIAFPNHYSVPYRLAYNFLNSIKRWPYPLEEKIFDLDAEAKACGFTVTGRMVMARKTALDYLYQIKIVGRLLRPLFKLIGCEGYLTVVTVRN